MADLARSGRDDSSGVVVSYTAGAGRPPASSSPWSLLPFLAAALVLTALRLLATASAMAVGGSGGTPSPTTQTWELAVLWIGAYLAEAVAGWLLWRRRRTSGYGRAALILFWVQLGLQGLRLLNLLGSRLTAGQLPWSAFGTVVLLDVVVIVSVLTAWQVSKGAGVLLCAVLAWLLYVTALTGADAVLQNGLPLT